MADKSTDKVDIAILIDSELRDLIRHRGLDVPRKATRTELVAALRASQDATYNGVSLSGSDHAVSSLCSALSDLTDVVRVLCIGRKTFHGSFLLWSFRLFWFVLRSALTRI